MLENKKKDKYKYIICNIYDKNKNRGLNKIQINVA